MTAGLWQLSVTRCLQVVGLGTGFLMAAGGLQARAATDAEPRSEPVAIIEAIDAASVTDLEFMDYLYEGMELSLGESGTVTLSYLSSCRVEQITGGQVTIGSKRSEVSSPAPIEVMEVNCGGGGIVPTDRQAKDAAGFAFRSSGAGEAPIQVFSTAPVFTFGEPAGELVIAGEGVGQTESYTLPVEGGRLDLAAHGVSLRAGALYRASAGDKAVLFKVSRRASGVGRTIVERLIHF